MAFDPFDDKFEGAFTKMMREHIKHVLESAKVQSYKNVYGRVAPQSADGGRHAPHLVCCTAAEFPDLDPRFGE